MLAVITGSTGLLGRHLAAQLSRQGWAIQAVVRKSSNRNTLLMPGVRFYECDLSCDELDPEIFRQADVVFHTAAAVTDWAPWSFFTANTIEATRRVCRAMTAAGCRRLVHISTVGVYGRPRATRPLCEDQPYASIGRWDYYTNSKIKAEQIVWQAQRDKLLQATVLRPAMIYGPGNTGLVSRVIVLLRKRKIRLVGNPQMPLPLVHVEDVASAALLSAASPDAVGKAFNVVNPELVTQEGFFNTIATLAGVPPVTRCIPYRLAYATGFAAEIMSHLLHSKTGPPISRYRVSLFGHPRTYATDRTQTILGWKPSVNFRDGIGTAVRTCLGPAESQHPEPSQGKAVR